MGKMYEDGVLEDYSLIKLTGQSCKIDLFREALKEFVPGRTIQFWTKRRRFAQGIELKDLVDGAVNYLKDKNMGFAVNIVEEPALPYRITPTPWRRSRTDSLPETKYSKRDDFSEYGGLDAEAVS